MARDLSQAESLTVLNCLEAQQQAQSGTRKQAQQARSSETNSPGNDAARGAWRNLLHRDGLWMRCDVGRVLCAVAQICRTPRPKDPGTQAANAEKEDRNVGGV